MIIKCLRFCFADAIDLFSNQIIEYLKKLNLLISVLEDPSKHELEIGDVIWDIVKEALLSLGFDLSEFEDEEEWNGYRYNWSSVAEYIVESDVFDNDYISS